MAKTEKREKGDIGEEVAFSYLKNNGYKILDRNYSNKFGEIDIIALKPSDKVLDKIIGGRQRGTVVFVEVKTRKISEQYNYDRRNNVRGSGGDELYPERNVDWRKQRKLARAAECYLIDKKYDDDTSWQIDVIGVELDEARNLANLRHIKNAVSM